jgi:hypothetical protein
VLDVTTKPSSKNSAKWLGFGTFNGKTFYRLSILRKTQRDPAGIQEACFLLAESSRANLVPLVPSLVK